MSKHFDILEIFSTGSTTAPQLRLGPNSSINLGLSVDSTGNFYIDASGGATPNISIGKQNTILGANAISIGQNAYASGSIAIGANSMSSGGTNVAIGSGARSTNTSCVAIGPGAVVSGQRSVAIGNNASGTSFDTVAIGTNTLASGNGSMIMGHIAAGSVTNSVGDSLALGWNENVISYLLAKSSNSYLHTTANFAIGHTNPATKLHVSGATRIQGLRADSAADTLQLYSSAGTPNVVFEDGGNVGIGTAAPSSVAILEITSTSKGFRMTPMTATQASAITPIEGLMVFVSNTNGTFTSIGFWGYENGAWAKL